MNVLERRKLIEEGMAENSALLLYAGEPVHISADDYTFEANRNFFYLTDFRRSKMVLLIDKTGASSHTTLFIERADPNLVRWTGKRVSAEEARETAMVDEVAYLDSYAARIDRLMNTPIDTLYFDSSRHSYKDMPDYNAYMAAEFAAKYPGVAIKNIAPAVAHLRMSKGPEEIERLREAIRITDEGLKNVLSRLKPGMMEYQAQADFEYMCKYCGAEGQAFGTIAGSGANSTMLHYGTNRDQTKDGDLLLMDLGAKYNGYCADITRTYPVNGKYTERQRKVYDIVLKTNRAIAATAKAGMTTRELNEICKKLLAEGAMELGLIKDPSEIGKYYMHGVSHHLGIDVHDVTDRADAPLPVGAVISDEPGLYIDEWEIGIRIEDDLYIKEDGCECLSEHIMRDPDEIEAYMASHRA